MAAEGLCNMLLGSWIVEGHMGTSQHANDTFAHADSTATMLTCKHPSWVIKSNLLC